MHSFCDGVTRRDAIRVGTASLFGSALGLPQLLRAAGGAKPKTDVSLIFIFLHGGQSHLDTFDLKPDAPAEFRGDFSPAKTKIPGLQICELLPKVATQVDKFSLVRSFRHHNSDHGPADHYILTGYFPQAAFIRWRSASLRASSSRRRASSRVRCSAVRIASMRPRVRIFNVSRAG